MAQFLAAAIAAAVIFFPLDMLWLGRVGTSFYKEALGPLMLDSPRIAPAALFYLAHVCGIAFFTIMPNLASGSSWMAALYGAAFGFVVYGAYDGSNHATLRDFPLSLAIVDWTWGTCLTALTAGLAHYLLTKFWV
jgi:uncharacterized membrane protein